MNVPRKALVVIVSALATAIAWIVPASAPEQASAAGALASDVRPIPAYIAPATRENNPGDRALAEWAFAAWSKATGNALTFRFVAEKEARLRLYWVTEQDGLYGEMRPIIVNGKQGAAVYVRPQVAGLGDNIEARAANDSLFRDAIVYLTCLHELGHALGLDHTDNYADIMFFFGYGGDIPNYFARYRRNLTQRSDIAAHSGLSSDDIARIRKLYPK